MRALWRRKEYEDMQRGWLAFARGEAEKIRGRLDVATRVSSGSGVLSKMIRLSSGNQTLASAPAIRRGAFSHPPRCRVFVNGQRVAALQHDAAHNLFKLRRIHAACHVHLVLTGQ
jgi:hypothetical protein